MSSVFVKRCRIVISIASIGLWTEAGKPTRIFFLLIKISLTEIDFVYDENVNKTKKNVIRQKSQSFSVENREVRWKL